MFRWMFLIVFLFSVSQFPTLTFASLDDPDVYADTIISSSTDVLSTTSSIGEPNGGYTDFLDEDTYIILDMGEELGTGDLTLHYFLIDTGAFVQIDFLDENNEEIDTYSDYLGVGETTFTAEYNGEDEGYRYVRIDSTVSATWRLDAIESEGYVEIIEGDETPTEALAEEGSEGVGDDDEVVDESNELTRKLVKLQDSSTVYYVSFDYVDGDIERHAFPNEAVFYSWYEGFSDVITVTSEVLAEIPLGENMYIRPGTYLVKQPYSPKTYAVEPLRVLREIASEEVAEELWGEDWNTRIIDLQDTIWVDYSIGNSISSAIYPDRSILIGDDGTYYYIQNGTRAWIHELDISTLLSNEDFVINVSDEVLDLYLDVGQLVFDESLYAF